MADETNNQQSEAQTTTSNATTENNGANGGQQGGQQQGKDDLKWLPARLEEAQASARKKLLTELGFENPDDLKALIEDAKKRREADMSEAEKAKAELDKVKAKATAAEQRAAELECLRIQDLVDAKLEGAAAGAEHPKDVIQWLRMNKADEVSKLADADGKVDEAAVKKMVEQLRKERPNFFKSSGPGSPSNRGGNNPGLDADGKRDAIKTFQRQIRRMT